MEKRFSIENVPWLVGRISPSRPRIRITISSDGSPVILNADDHERLRRELHIIGCLMEQQIPYPCGEGYQSVSMTLHPWECTLLVAYKLAEIDYNPFKSCIRVGEHLLHNLKENDAGENADDVVEECKEDVIDESLDETEGKRRKLRRKKRLLIHSKRKKTKSGPSMIGVGLEPSKTLLIEVELGEVRKPLPTETCVRKLYKYPWLGVDDAGQVQWRYPIDRNGYVLFRVYEDLWKQGNYVDVDCKFGGSFLVYTGDPSISETFSIMVCAEDIHSYPPSNVDKMCRLGTMMKKHITFATLDKKDDKDVLYLLCEAVWNPDEVD